MATYGERKGSEASDGTAKPIHPVAAAANNTVVAGALCRCLAGYDLRTRRHGWLSLRIDTTLLHSQVVCVHAFLHPSFVKPALVWLGDTAQETIAFMHDAVADMRRAVDEECMEALESHLADLRLAFGADVTTSPTMHKEVVTAWLDLAAAFKTMLAFGAPFTSLHGVAFVRELKAFADNHAFALHVQHEFPPALTLLHHVEEGPPDLRTRCTASCSTIDVVTIYPDLRTLREQHHAACEGLARLRRAVHRFQCTWERARLVCTPGTAEAAGTTEVVETVADHKSKCLIVEGEEERGAQWERRKERVVDSIMNHARMLASIKNDELNELARSVTVEPQ